MSQRQAPWKIDEQRAHYDWARRQRRTREGRREHSDGKKRHPAVQEAERIRRRRWWVAWRKGVARWRGRRRWGLGCHGEAGSQTPLDVGEAARLVDLEVSAVCHVAAPNRQPSDLLGGAAMGAPSEGWRLESLTAHAIRHTRSPTRRGRARARRARGTPPAGRPGGSPASRCAWARSSCRCATCRGSSRCPCRAPAQSSAQRVKRPTCAPVCHGGLRLPWRPPTRAPPAGTPRSRRRGR